MHIVVCMKQIIDPEAPASRFAIDAERRGALRGDAPLVASIFDENALEVALQLREKNGQGRITLISIGPDSAEEILRKGMGKGSDDAVLVQCDNLEELDSFAVASVLAATIRKLDSVDLVLCGRETGDWNTGQVGALLAEELHLCYVPFVAGIERTGKSLRLRAQANSGWEIVEAPLPALVTVTNDDANVPRIAKIKDVIMASRRDLKRLTLPDLELDSLPARLQIRDLYIPVAKGNCEFISGESAEEKVQRLCEKLAALKII
jgi:electron transfer flavoprotein beta subunit